MEKREFLVFFSISDNVKGQYVEEEFIGYKEGCK